MALFCTMVISELHFSCPIHNIATHNTMICGILYLSKVLSGGGEMEKHKTYTEVAVVTDKRREQAEKYESGLKGRNPVSVCDNYQKWIKFCRGRHNRSAPASAVTHVIHL